MLYENHFYGNALILATYAALGFDEITVETPTGERWQRKIPRRIRPAIIPGLLQHGWVPETQFRVRKRRTIRIFVWNERSLNQHLAGGDARVTAIGAPFLYLRKGAAVLGEGLAEDPTLPTDSDDKRVLAYPFHGRLADQPAPHGTLASALLERGFDGATVCLAFDDYIEPETRSAYESLGFNVICNGLRTDPTFLVRQHATLQRFDHVVTNRVSSALWYAGSLGRRIEVVGEPWADETARDVDDIDGLQRNRWPSLFSGGVSGSAAVEMSEAELGFRFVREPEDLAALFGWDRWLTRARNLAGRSGCDARTQVLSWAKGVTAPRPSRSAK